MLAGVWRYDTQIDCCDFVWAFFLEMYGLSFVWLAIFTVMCTVLGRERLAHHTIDCIYAI